MSPVSKRRKPEKRRKKRVQKQGTGTEVVHYICLQCKEGEPIPLEVVRNFDAMDDGDPIVPPQFACEHCGGEMYPEYYKGIHGYEYRISDVLRYTWEGERHTGVASFRRCIVPMVSFNRTIHLRGSKRSV